MLSLGVVLALAFIAVIILVIFFQFIPFGLWLTALFSGIRVPFFTLFGMAMSRKHVIVKRLNAIQNFGAMDVLCTDKTGTLTMDSVLLERHCDVEGKESDRVLVDAMLISHLQTGLKSALDLAILKHQDHHPEVRLDGYRKVDEIPFDFSRRIMPWLMNDFK